MALLQTEMSVGYYFDWDDDPYSNDGWHWSKFVNSEIIK